MLLLDDDLFRPRHPPEPQAKPRYSQRFLIDLAAGVGLILVLLT